MKSYKTGTKFKVCGHDELLKKGWLYNSKFAEYTNSKFGFTVIAEIMIRKFEGQTLTISGISRSDWYTVQGNTFIWPVATFFDDSRDDNQDDHTCKEGVTPIGGWIICKFCGMDLIKI